MQQKRPIVICKLLERIGHASKQLEGQLQGSASPNMKQMADLMELHKKAISALLEGIKEWNRRLTAALEAEYLRLQERPQREKECLDVIAQHGWYVYIPWEWRPNDDFSVAEALAAGSVDQVDDALCSFFQKELETIEQTLCSDFPNRERILHSAFEAHRKEQYALCIPVFLAQADGICIELTGGKELYTKNHRKMVGQFIKSLLLNEYAQADAHPFIIAAPICEKTEQWQEHVGVLNRHAVLHGIDTEYDTRLNSFKAISMLSSVNNLLRDLSDEDQQAKKTMV